MDYRINFYRVFVLLFRNDKYIPPSRRQTSMAPGAPHPVQPHPPSNNNGPPHNSNNNSALGRKPMYNQNQNPRNNYGAPPNAVYHQDRRNFDRRAPPPNQYGNTVHGDMRRPLPGDDGGQRPQRLTNKVPLDRKGWFRKYVNANSILC